MENILPPSDGDLAALREQVKAANRTAEFKELQDELKSTLLSTVTAPSEFEGAMRIQDTQQVLKAKRKSKDFMELLIERIKGMFAMRPVIGNIIGLLAAVLALYYIFNEIDNPFFIKYRAYFVGGIELTAAYQIIKSGTRSLTLPVLAMAVGAIVSHTLTDHQTLFNFSKAFYTRMTIVGVIGMGVSILTID